MTFREFCIKFAEEQWSILLLFLLFLLLISAHAFMIHANRPPEIIHWAEGMIGACFTAIIAKLK